MTQIEASARQPRRDQTCRSCRLASMAGQVVMVLCWTGVIPVAQLVPATVAAAFEPYWRVLLAPVLCLAAATILVDALRLAGTVRGRIQRVALLALQIAGVLLACFIVKDVAALPYSGPGLGATPDQQVLLFFVHSGATAASAILPFVLVIIVVTGLLLRLIRGDLLAA